MKVLYLGLPRLIGRSENAVFVFLKDKLKEKNAVFVFLKDKLKEKKFKVGLVWRLCNLQMKHVQVRAGVNEHWIKPQIKTGFQALITV